MEEGAEASQVAIDEAKKEVEESGTIVCLSKLWKTADLLNVTRYVTRARL